MHGIPVTAFGIVSPIGNSIGEFESRMFDGSSGIVDLRGSLVSHNFPAPYGGVIDDSLIPTAEEFGLPSGLHTNGGRYLMSALQQVLDEIPENIRIDGIVQASPAGIFLDPVLDSLKQYDPDNFIWDEIRAEWLLEIMNEWLKRRGNGTISPENLISINSACAAGSQAIGIARDLIRSGVMNRCLVCAVDAGAWESQLMNFHFLHTLATGDVPAYTASRPFSKSRTGFVKGEAAAVLLLESIDAAHERDADILGEISG